jgi:hypothetical protein
MGELLGKQIQPRAIAGLAYTAGIHDARRLVVAVALALAECQGYDRAFNDNLDAAGSVTSRDCGIWQINIPASEIGTAAEATLYDPAENASNMYRLFATRGWQPWVSYNTKVYLHDTYLRRAALGVMNFLAEALVEQATAAGQTPTTRVPMISSHELARIYP